jgi:cysteinyl-tRNA synthetase
MIKLSKYPRKKKTSLNKITTDVIKAFHVDCDNLNCLKPTKEPKATDHINEMIKMISSLIDKKFAYESNGHVYFSVSSYKHYGKLSNKNLDQLKSGVRIETSDLKKNQMDFVLWKPSDNTEPGWSSPWGKGRPGWHLECSVMSEKYLGKNFDIHGGGLDLIFPHHENEIAQSCCNNSTDNLANYWLHNGFVTMNKEKMSKSLGNVITISDAVKKYSGQVVRLSLLSGHYSQPLDWNDKLLENIKNTIDKWYNLYEKTSDENILSISETLLDDLNTPGFIAKIHELYTKAQSGDKKSKILFNNSCRFLGLFNIDKEEWENFKKNKIKISVEYIEKKINERLKARKNGNFKLADKLRDELLNNGIVIEDQKGKTNWKYK